MSEHEWKAGDMAMVKIKSVADYDDIRLDHGIRVPASLLRPLPSPDPLNEAERRVVEEWVRWRTMEPVDGHGRYIATHRDALAATDALIAILRNPVDPMAELRAAWVAWLGGISTAGSSEKFKRLEAAIGAIEKAHAP
jgi:hypothetical protein